jgi:tetratricopeptide (TPR) repeat protein
MDALRKAEEAKRAATKGEDGVLPGKGTPDAYAGEGNNEDELTLEPLEQNIAPERAPPASKPRQARPIQSKPTPQPAIEAQRNTIQNAFNAKAPAKTPLDKAFVATLATLGTLCLAGGGIYVWLQTQPRSSLAATTQNSAPLAPPLAQAVPVPAAAPETLPPVSSATQEEPLPRELASAPPRSARHDRQVSARGEPTDSEPIRISQNKARINPLLEEGYAALQRGSHVQAKQAYERMLAVDPKNLDALYGLAAVAVAQKQAGLAEDHYLRILEIDPRDPVAHAGLAGLTVRASGNAESRLKTLIADQPNVPQLQFALGNVYAQSQRWRDAQQAYFLAYKNDGENPDAAFNLAVSLDQLHQGKLAAQYYTEALRLASGRPSAFNREQVQARLRDLQGQAAQ